MSAPIPHSDETGIEPDVPLILKRVCGISEGYVTGTSAAGAAFLGIASLLPADCNLRIILGWLGVALVLIAIFVSILRGWYQRQVKARTQSVLTERTAQQAELMEAQAVMLAHLASVAEEKSQPQRDKRVEASRTAIMALGARLVGSSSARVTLFRAQTDETSLWFEAEGLGYGRTVASTRVFKAGNPTYEEAVAGRIRFVEDCGKDDGAGGRIYRTYMNAPILNGNGGIYGIVAVDRKNPGDLVQERDEPILNYLSKLLALNLTMDRSFTSVEGYFTGRGGTP